MNQHQRSKWRSHIKSRYMFHTIGDHNNINYKGIKRILRISRDYNNKGKLRTYFIYETVYVIHGAAREANALALIEGKDLPYETEVTEILLGGQKGVWA